MTNIEERIKLYNKCVKESTAPGNKDDEIVDFKFERFDSVFDKNDMVARDRFEIVKSILTENVGLHVNAGKKDDVPSDSSQKSSSSESSELTSDSG